tara:strand:+ start:190 stop:381 length:192 start_codon:yes stop_codon:yes gene_type:complete
MKSKGKEYKNRSFYTYSVFVGGSEVNDYLLSKAQAVNLAYKYKFNDYKDVKIVEVKRPDYWLH